MRLPYLAHARVCDAYAVSEYEFLELEAAAADGGEAHVIQQVAVREVQYLQFRAAQRQRP